MMNKKNAVDAKNTLPGVVYRSLYNAGYSYTREGKSLVCVETGGCFPISSLQTAVFYPCPDSNEE